MTVISIPPTPASAPQVAEPIVFLINGSGLGVCLLAGFAALTAYMISREARQ